METHVRVHQAGRLTLFEPSTRKAEVYLRMYHPFPGCRPVGRMKENTGVLTLGLKHRADLIRRLERADVSVEFIGPAAHVWSDTQLEWFG